MEAGAKRRLVGTTDSGSCAGAAPAAVQFLYSGVRSHRNTWPLSARVPVIP